MPDCVIVSIDSASMDARYGVMYHLDARLSSSDVASDAVAFDSGRLLAALSGDHRDPLAVRLPNPRNFTQSQTYPDAGSWKHAYQVEIDNFIAKGVMTPSNPPVGPAAAGIRVETLQCKEVCTYKYLADGTIDKRKVRICARGDCQGPDTYYDTFAPSVQLHSVRLILSLAAIWSLDMFHFDVSAAFLNSDLSVDNIWIQLPPG